MNVMRSRCVWVLPLCILVGLPASAQVEDTSTSEYYFADGQRIDLTRAEQWVAVRFKEPAEAGLSAQMPDGIDFSSRRDLGRNRLTLLPIQGILTQDARQTLVADLATNPTVELVARVYRADGGLMIVTDEFVACFRAGISPAQISRINQEHGVRIVRKLLNNDHAYVLQVPEGAALGTANTFHLLAEVEYAHPDFVRVMPPRPADLGPQDRRMIFTLDGTPLSPDTEIEKGRNDLLMIEPAVEIYPSGESKTLGMKASPTPVTRTTLKSEDYEGSFPNDWTLYGDPTWGQTGYRAYSGSTSAYCVGSSVLPPGPYTHNLNSWMLAGPYDLSDAVDARLDLQTWVSTELNYDYLFIGASTNGSNFYGLSRSGGWAAAHGGDGWMNIALDLKRIPTLGDLTGEPQVWIGIKIGSDSSISYEGVYVDDVVFEKITGGYQSLTSDQYDHLQWSLSNNEQLWGTVGADIQAVDAWGVTHGSDSITIAIIDEGVDLTHPDLVAKLVAGYDATDGGGSGGPSGNDAHGTGCAGIAAATTNNSLGVAGIDRAAKIMPIRIAYDDGAGNWVTSDSWTADGISWAADNGADVLSNSWGGGTPATVISAAVADAKTTGRGGLGAVVLFAAGNHNGGVIYPATLPTVLAVGALSPCDERKKPTSCDGEWAWGSCYGPEIDIAAPGVHMYTTDISGSAGYDAGDYYYNFNGTSSATPVVAGVAALILGQNPSMTAAEVEAQLMATADDLGPPGWDEETGFGRVNAYRALTEGLSTCYPLTLGHTGSGSNPTPVPTNSPGCAAGEFFEGATVNLSAVPAAGWIVSGWSGTDDDGSAASINTVTMPASSHSASVNYTQIPCYTLTTSHSGSGSDPGTNPVNSPGCIEGDYHAGETVSLVAIPSPGWAVNGWSGTDDDASLASINTVTMPAAGHAASVTYVAIPAGCYALNRRHTGSGSDPVPDPWASSGCPGETYTSGETVILTAAPATGWTVGGWWGTNDDDSFLWTNMIEMQDEDSTVLVRYVTPTLVKDIRSGPVGAFNRDDFTVVSYTRPANVGSTLFIAANDGVHGMELWKSDGTEAGTMLVKDIWPGANSAFPWLESNTWFSQTFVNVGGTLFFVASDGVHDYEVWKSDGTAAGTMMVKDIYGSWDAIPQNLTNVNGTLYFSHTNGTDGVELWKSNGTSAGTVMVKDINSGAGGSNPSGLAEYNGMLVFGADDGTYGKEPWISDGTEAGTKMLKDIDPASGSSPGEFTQVGSSLFFSASDESVNFELWKSDGTESGTVMVKNIAPTWYGSHPSELEAMDGTLFFRASDDGLYVDHGIELWKSDGTDAGTVMVKDIWSGSDPSWPTFMTHVDGMVLFKANTPDQGDWGGELWRTDGTGAGTVMVKDIYPNPNPTNMWPKELTEAGGSLLFSADDLYHGRELWWSDGTEAGTRLIKDLNVGEFSSSPEWFVDADGVVFFRAFEGVHGRELWVLTNPSGCHLLMVSRTGMGSVPTPSPAQSVGCDPGFFEAGEVITLTASPGPGWQVVGWSGTDNDGSTSTVNQVTMPGIDHAVTVDYYSPPIFVDGFESGDTSVWSSTRP